VSVSVVACHAWQLASNSFDASFAPPEDKARWHRQLADVFSRFAAA
jgi:adenosine deaminase